jgi:hypothetical protein
MQFRTSSARRLVPGLAVAALLGVAAATASAASVTFSGSGSTQTQSASASATFDIVGSQLVITLKNTTAGPTLVDQPSLLMGVYWNSNSLGALGSSSLSSVDLNGSTLLNGTNPGWFALGIGSGPVAGKYGVTASSWSLGTTTSLQQLTGAPAPGTPVVADGPDGGIISAAGTTSGKVVLKDAVTYSIALPGTVDKNSYLASIANVSFLYGTGDNDGRTFNGGTPPAVPVPAAVWAGGSMLAALGLKRFFRRV